MTTQLQRKHICDHKNLEKQSQLWYQLQKIVLLCFGLIDLKSIYEVFPLSQPQCEYDVRGYATQHRALNQ